MTRSPIFPEPYPDLLRSYVSGVTGSLSHLAVTLDILHTYDSDLDIKLIAPNGTQVMLSDNRGDWGENFTETIFDDSAATAIASGSAPFTGTYRPDQPLSALNGIDPNGTWQISIYDVATDDTGALRWWSLDIATTE